jgi:hypothetical protein
MTFNNGGRITGKNKNYSNKSIENTQPKNTHDVLQDVDLVARLTVSQENPNAPTDTTVVEFEEGRQLLSIDAPTDGCRDNKCNTCFKFYCVTRLTIDGQKSECLSLNDNDAILQGFDPETDGFEEKNECDYECDKRYYCDRTIDPPACVRYHPSQPEASGLKSFDSAQLCEIECSKKYYCFKDNTGLFESGCKLRDPSDDSVQDLVAYNTQEECESSCARKWYCIENALFPVTGLGEPSTCEYRHQDDASVTGLTPFDTKDDCETTCKKSWYCVSDDVSTSCERLSSEEAENNIYIVSGPHLLKTDCETSCSKRFYCVPDPLGGSMSERSCIRYFQDDPRVEGLPSYLTSSECADACASKYYCLLDNRTLTYGCRKRSRQDPKVQGLPEFDTVSGCADMCKEKWYCLPDSENSDLYDCRERFALDSEVDGLTGYDNESDCDANCYYAQSQYFNIVP